MPDAHGAGATPITAPGTPTVLIGGMPAAGVGDIVTCGEPPDAIVMGSMTTLIGGRPAARMRDPCAPWRHDHAGRVTVLIG